MWTEQNRARTPYNLGCREYEARMFANKKCRWYIYVNFKTLPLYIVHLKQERFHPFFFVPFAGIPFEA